jgi:hypothetical protein
LRFREQLPEAAEELDGFIAAVKAFMLREHNDDGTHNFIRAVLTRPSRNWSTLRRIAANGSGFDRRHSNSMRLTARRHQPGNFRAT